MTFDFAKYKDKTLTRPRDEAWNNWKSWEGSKIGDTVKGFIADAFYRPEEKRADGQIAFREQRAVTLKQEDGTLINVGIKYLPFILASTDNLHVGDPLVIEFSEQLQPREKGQKGAKVFKFYGEQLPANAKNPTVKELTDADRLAGGSQAPEEVADDKDVDPTSVDAF